MSDWQKKLQNRLKVRHLISSWYLVFQQDFREMIFKVLFALGFLISLAQSISRKFHPSEVYDRGQEHEPGGRERPNQNGERPGVIEIRPRSFIPRENANLYKMDPKTLGLVYKDSFMRGLPRNEYNNHGNRRIQNTVKIFATRRVPFHQRQRNRTGRKRNPQRPKKGRTYRNKPFVNNAPGKRYTKYGNSNIARQGTTYRNSNIAGQGQRAWSNRNVPRQKHVRRAGKRNGPHMKRVYPSKRNGRNRQQNWPGNHKRQQTVTVNRSWRRSPLAGHTYHRGGGVHFGYVPTTTPHSALMELLDD